MPESGTRVWRVDDEGGERAPGHQPVLLAECLEALRVRPGGRYIDATLGGGGHAGAILERSSPGGRLLGIDRDGSALAAARERLAAYGDRLTTAAGDFAGIGRLAGALGWEKVDGIIFDLGISSMQVDEADRGFSFRGDARLDMRMDRSQALSAFEIVNEYPPEELSRIFREYGEERKAKKVAATIVEERKKRSIETTAQLAAVVARAAGGTGGRIHPATRVFQALRISVNGELKSLEAALPLAAGLLADGGRLAVIAYHSLEDRIVKESFRFLAGRCACPPGQPVCTCGAAPLLNIVTRRPMRPAPDEIRRNRRSRSARLRVAEKAPRP